VSKYPFGDHDDVWIPAPAVGPDWEMSQWEVRRWNQGDWWIVIYQYGTPKASVNVWGPEGSDFELDDDGDLRVEFEAPYDGAVATHVPLRVLMEYLWVKGVLPRGPLTLVPPIQEGEANASDRDP